MVSTSNRLPKFYSIAHNINDYTNVIRLLAQGIQPRATPARTAVEPLLNLYLPAAE